MKLLADFNFAVFSPMSHSLQGSHRLEKFLNLEGFLEKSLKKSTGKSCKDLEMSLNYSIFCRH